MKLSRREFLAIGAALALSACGRSGGGAEHVDESPETVAEPEPEPIVDESTTYEVIRADMKGGVAGDVEVLSWELFEDDYATLAPDGTFNFSLYGVAYNGTLADSGQTTTHLYSGSTTDVERLLLDGAEVATVGSVDIEAFMVDSYILVEMYATVDGTWTGITLYLTQAMEG